MVQSTGGIVAPPCCHSCLTSAYQMDSFTLIFVYNVRKGSMFILLHVGLQLSWMLWGFFFSNKYNTLFIKKGGNSTWRD